MSRNRWPLVRSLLEGALPLAGRAREEFLRTGCGADSDLRAEIDALLALERDAPSFEPPWLDASSVADSSTPIERIGVYRLERSLGSGGMGEVYLARREGPGFEQPVALKLVKLGMDTREILARFARERALLASLAHDGITRLLDAGAIESGRPYLVMEYVEGEPIDRWCDAHRLDVRARVALFREVCGAVQFAHERLVLHRDLKPGNIFITARGRPKLLDFGLAKLIAAEGEAEELTLTGQRLHTPAYASPEQLRGERVGVASDVYSLGIVLYELLVGERPFTTARALAPASELVAERPSTRVRADSRAAALRKCAPRRLKSELVGDLDTILLRALHPDVAQRYPTVEALSRDLGRYLDGLPVEARPDSWTYRAAKFVRRHRAGVGASVVVLGALVASGAWAVRSYREVVLARERAEDQRGIAEQRREHIERREAELRRLAVRLMVDVHDSIQSLRGATGPREALMRISSEALESVVAGNSMDAQALLDVGDAFERLGAVQGSTLSGNLGQMRSALESLCRAQQIASRALTLEPHSLRAHELLARTHRHLASIRLAQGDFEAAAWELERFAIEQARSGGSPAMRASDSLDAMVARAELALGERRFDDAALLFERAIELASEAVAEGLHEPSPAFLARAEDGLSRAERGRGNDEAALEHSDVALALMREAVSADPDKQMRALAYSLALERGSRSRCSLGRLEEGIALARENVALMEQVLARDPTEAEARLQAGNASAQLGLALKMQGEDEQAHGALVRAVDVLAALSRENPSSVHVLRDLAVAEQLLATTQVYLGRIEAATASFDSAMEHIGAAARAASDARPLEQDALGFQANWIVALHAAAFDGDELRDATLRDVCQKTCEQMFGALDRDGGEARAPAQLRAHLPLLRDMLERCRASREPQAQTVATEASDSTER